MLIIPLEDRDCNSPFTFDGVTAREGQGAGQLLSVGGRILIQVSLTSKPCSVHYVPLCPSLSPMGTADPEANALAPT